MRRTRVFVCLFQRFISACSPEKMTSMSGSGCEMWHVCVWESGSESTLVLAKCHSLYF